MAKEPTQADQKPEPSTTAASPDAKNFSVKKLLMFGVPIFLVQVVVIYFIVTKFIFPPAASQAAEKDTERTPVVTGDTLQQVFVVSDLIVNPAGTNGTRFLLTTIGIEVATPEAKAELQKKEIQVRDALISILTSKGLDQLARVDQREIIRNEIVSRMGDLMASGRPKNVYFGKFIIQ